MVNKLISYNFHNIINGFKDTNTTRPPPNDFFYAPLNQHSNICGIGANLILVHDPPLSSNHPPKSGQTVSYINIIDSLEKNTPASKAGLQSGDIVIEVNGTNVVDRQKFYLPEEVSDMIRGEEGSEVVVVVQRDGVNRKHVLIREPLVVASSSSSSSSSSSMMVMTASSSPSSKAMPVTPDHKRGRFF